MSNIRSGGFAAAGRAEMGRSGSRAPWKCACAIKQLYTFNHRICYLQATYYANPPQAILSAAGLFCKISIKLQQKLIILCRKFCLLHRRDREEYSNAR